MDETPVRHDFECVTMLCVHTDVTLEAHRLPRKCHLPGNATFDAFLEESISLTGLLWHARETVSQQVFELNETKYH